jgi:hypothetical protein
MLSILPTQNAHDIGHVDLLYITIYMKCLYNLNSALYCNKITEIVINCTKRLLFKITSSLLLTFIRKCVKHYSYLAHLHEMQIITNML